MTSLDWKLDEMERDWLRNTGWGVVLKVERGQLFFTEKQQGKMICKYLKKCLNEEKDFLEREVLRYRVLKILCLYFMAP